MEFSLKNLVRFILFAWLYCLVPSLSIAQTPNQDPITSVSAVNEPISQVLDRLSRNTGITFSYNPDHLEASRPVSINMTNKKLSEILTFLLPPDKFGYRFSGNQVVVFRTTISKPTDNPEKNALTEAAGNKPPKVITDTVFVSQIQTFRDTIALTDTIVRYDTVFIMRTVTRDKPITGKEIFSNQTKLSEEQTRDLKFEAGFSLTWLAARSLFKAPLTYSSKLDEYRDSNSGSIFSGTACVDLRMSYARLSLNTGVSYTSFNGKLDYSYSTSTGGYFQKDTLDAYYTLNNSDTSWFYVLDSAYLPIDLKAYRFKTSVSHQFVEIPFSLQYNHPFGRKLIYVNAGLIAGINTGSSGLMILADRDGVVEMQEVKFRPLVFSSVFGAGILVPVTGTITFDAGVMYRQHLSSVLNDFPIDLRSRALGIKAGLVWKL